MNKEKNAEWCFLDVKDLVKINPGLNAISCCPACHGLVSNHSDSEFLLQQLGMGVEDINNIDEEERKEDSEDSPQRKRKRVTEPLNSSKAETPVEQGKNCCMIGCTRRPSYNTTGLKPRYCRLHKDESMVNCTTTSCQCDGCENVAIFKEARKRGGLKVCSEHKRNDMVKIGDKGGNCAVDGCFKTASFNFKGYVGRYCGRHKQEGMVNIYRQRCRFEGCDLTASFNLPGTKTARYCSFHKDKDMINIKVIPCAEEGCCLKPYYNFPGEKRGKYCTQHREEGMVNLLAIKANRVCDSEGCEKCACFAFSKKDNVRYCASHKEPGMIDVQNLLCESDGCGKRPNFNFPGFKKGRFCAKHKEDGMTNVVNERRKEREVAAAVATTGSVEL